MLFAFIAENEEGRAVLALIREIRECRACVPELYVTCAQHQAALDRLYPERCAGPDCPACKVDGQ